MTVRVLFFGLLKDITGMAEDHLTADAGATLDSVFEQYAARFPKLRELRASIVLAANYEFSASSRVLQDGDEVALLPPVSGGADLIGQDSRWTHSIARPEGHFYALTRKPIDAGELTSRLLRGEDGAIVDFQGVVRNNTNGRPTLYLDYECYEPMAIRTMAGIGDDIVQRHAIGRIALVHRLGRMEIGESSVAVLVAAPHRRPAFEAALEGINRLKKTVPIWKKEYFADGEVWVEGEWDSSVLPH